MKIKEITEGFLDAIATGLSRFDKSGTHYREVPYKPDPNKKPVADKDMWDVKMGFRKIDEPEDTDDSKETTQGHEQPQNQEQPKLKPRKQQTRQEQPKPKDDPNTNLNTKIGYLVQQGFLQSGRISDDEKRYIDGVDVWVDENKFAKEDPSTRFIKATRPHHSLFMGSVQIPMSEWQKALGRSGEGLSGYVSFDLTPAGWWSTDFNAYINPNNQLDDLVSRYQRG